ncbi:patatin-domain-containing protein [Terfezia boudieri ATCC MYA-4762]|uniref:Lysophospholipase NTE1 n=1 Tax=Terfezia boudieri ATCC MYA-4762 TaxID=1051890 RepID=A0A3N4LB63_9PEZI|nr:patatin-domain-containing protein [Terfezia boudieri ATCC MYA-4762]
MDTPTVTSATASELASTLWIVIAFVTFSTFTVPTWLFMLFSTSLTVTMNFTTLLLIAFALGSGGVWFVRYRLLNMYPTLPHEPQRKEPEIDLFPDSQGGDSKPGLSNYLDEFLSAIKIFGYLERPVFHELTRHMQTRRLIAGETFLLEEEKGFCLVVDGLMQIFVKQNRHGENEECICGECSLCEVDSKTRPWRDPREGAFHDEEDESVKGAQGYQLLTEVKNGAPLSSLFTILSLFTEDVKLRHEFDDFDGGVDSSGSSTFGRTGDGPFAPITDTAMPTSDAGYPMQRDASGEYPRGPLLSVPPLSLNDESPSHMHPSRPITPIENRPKSPKPKKTHSVHPDIIARASVDTTIAVIPDTAFRRLTRIYPKATAHIVQVILTRFQRVTFLTAYSYLGLTSEVLRTEKFMNKYTMYELPNYLRGGALDRLKEKFKTEQERAAPEDQMKGLVLHNPSANANKRRTSSISMRKEALIHAKLAGIKGTPSAALDTASPPPRKLVNGNSVVMDGGQGAGDLSTNAIFPSSRGKSLNNPFTGHDSNGLGSFHEGYDAKTPLALSFNPFARYQGRYPHEATANTISEDSAFREAVLDCIYKAIGLTQSVRNQIESPTAHHSPGLTSYDARNSKTSFSNAFGMLDPFEGMDDSESVISTTLSTASTSGGLFGQHSDMKNEVEIVFFPKGSVLVEQGERNPGLYYVIDGFLDVSIPVDEKKGGPNTSLDLGAGGHATAPDHELPPLTRTTTNSSFKTATAGSGGKKMGRKSLFMIKPGGLAGYIGSMSAYRSFIDVRAKTDVYVGFLPRDALERIVDRHPVVLLTMAKRLTSLLPRLILHIDFALEWVQIDAGQVIYHQGDESDAIYIVLNGRLRGVLDDKNGQMQVVGEFGQGESVGELEVLTETTRPATVHAIRDTELARFPKTLFNSLAMEHPGITIQISKIIASRMRTLIDNPLKGEMAGYSPAGIIDRTTASSASPVKRGTNSTVNLRTVCILPVTAGVPVTEFGNRLSSALQQVGIANGVTLLNQAVVLSHLGRHAFSKMGKLKLSGYLADLEEKFGMVLYVADTNVNSPWTQTCISQADCILVIGLAEASPKIGEYERFLVGMKSTARKELVLLHVERYCRPGLTRKWLRNRIWINGGHHHIQMAFRTTPEPVHQQTKRFSSVLRQRVQFIHAEIAKYTSRRILNTPIYSSETPFKGDFHRLARRLCGKSIGLVLGGGGARGISQVGLIRALEEAGIPIDMVGGTSIGAFNGALYARDADIVPVYGRAKKFAGRMASIWRFVLDLTYPSCSYTTGQEFNRGIFKTFGSSQIEDFWLEFYCNSTSISKSRMEIHTNGYAWRYIRASMSLAGLLPPLCDDGQMLLDGGYVDNLTVAHMKSLGADIIFAVDVGSIDDTTPQQFGDSLSGAWAFFNRWNPFSAYPNPPTLAEIQSRLAYVSSVDALERAKMVPGCVYMRPPIDGYGTLDFGKFDEICELGYQYGKRFLAELREKGGIEGLWLDGSGVGSSAGSGTGEEKRKIRRMMAPRRASI